MNAAPSWRHQEISYNLATVLKAAAPGEVKVLEAPVWRIGPGQIPQPDLVVVEPSALGDVAVEGTPLMMAEILSPSNRWWDLVRKWALYAEAGCPDYWIVDPAGPSIIVLHLQGDEYVEAGRFERDQRIVLDRPFPMELRPADL